MVRVITEGIEITADLVHKHAVRSVFPADTFRDLGHVLGIFRAAGTGYSIQGFGMIIFVILLSGFVQGNSVLPALAVEISIDIDQPCIGVERDPAAAAMDAFNPGTEFLCSSHLLTGQISGELRIVPVVVPSNQKQEIGRASCRERV